MMEKNSRAFGWASGYLGVILLFALCYLCLPIDQWGGNERILDFGDAFYFSVVTITSLGFGDIYPAAGTAGRYLVATEAILGILIIGFFLNDIALSQTKVIDKSNKEKEERKRKDAAIEKLRLYAQELRPVLERYLRGVYEVITPLEKREFPVDFLHHTYSFQFKDLYGLYGNSLMMNNEFSEPVVSIHLRNQDVLYQVLKEFVTNADLSYWPDLEMAIFHFVQRHHEFQFKDVILNNGLILVGGKQNIQQTLSKMILETEGEPGFNPNDRINAYVALYYSLKDNIQTVQRIWGAIEMEVK